METALTRRQALIGATAGLFAARWPRLAAAQAAAPALTLMELGPDLTLVSGAGANVVVLATADGLLVVDGGAARHSAALQSALAERWPGRRVEVLFNSNWREEHSGGNAAMRAAGATVMAHENTKLWLGGDFFVEWEDRHYAPRPAAELPNKTFYKSGSVDFGGRRVDYWYVPRAHTDGDVAVFFGDANLLVASDLLSVDRYPVPDYATGGWIGGLVEATKKLLALTNADTLIVPANGPAQRRTHLQAQLDMLTVVRERVENLMRKGRSIEEMLAAGVTNEFDSKWGSNGDRFVANIYNGLWWAGRLSDSL